MIFLLQEFGISPLAGYTVDLNSDSFRVGEEVKIEFNNSTAH